MTYLPFHQQLRLYGFSNPPNIAPSFPRYIGLLTSCRQYQSGFGNAFESEAIPGTWPRNSLMVMWETLRAYSDYDGLDH
jgi:hypothetical protein